MEAIFKQAKEEQEQADRAFEEEQQAGEAIDSKKLGAQTNATTKPGVRGRKAAKQPAVGNATSLKLGSNVQVVSGSFAGFSGILKKLDKKTGLVYSLTLIP